MEAVVDIKELVGRLPQGRLEQYRNTPVGALYAKVDTIADHSEIISSSDMAMPCAECGLNICVDNGHSDGALRRLPSGVIYGSLARAKEEFSELVSPLLGSEASKSSDCYSKLCESMAMDGAFIYVPEGVDINEPFTIVSRFSAAEGAATFERHLISLAPTAKARVVFKRVEVVGEQGESGIVASDIIETFIGEGAELDIANVCDMGGGSLVSHCYTVLAAKSSCTSVDMGVSASLCRVNHAVKLEGEEAHAGVYGLFAAGSGELFDYHTSIAHNAPRCTSDEHFKDIIAEGGVGVFRGRIYVAQDAQQTDAQQQNNNILLGNGAKVFTKPELEIYADDVKCNHGATIGRPDDDAIYYMRQRGIGEFMARRLQMTGFVNDIISRCKINCLADDIVDRITTKIENL